MSQTSHSGCIHLLSLWINETLDYSKLLRHSEKQVMIPPSATRTTQHPRKKSQQEGHPPHPRPSNNEAAKGNWMGPQSLPRRHNRLCRNPEASVPFFSFLFNSINFTIAAFTKSLRSYIYPACHKLTLVKPHKSQPSVCNVQDQRYHLAVSTEEGKWRDASHPLASFSAFVHWLLQAQHLKLKSWAQPVHNAITSS